MAIAGKTVERPFTEDERGKLLTQAIGSSPQGYRGTFKQAATDLGQPGEQIGGFENFVTSGTQELAESFVGRYFKKTGQLPDADQVKSFVASNLTPDYARKYIQGGINRDITDARYADPYLDSIDLPAAPGTQQTPYQALPEKLDNIYKTIGENESNTIRREFAPSMRRAIEEEAAAPGRLRSGVSYGKYSPIQQARENEGNALSNLIAKLAESRATGEFSAATSESDLGERMRQFNKGLGLERQKFSFAQNQAEEDNQRQREGIRLSETLGRLQAEGKKPGTLDYVNTGANVLSSLVGTAKAFKGA